MIVIVVHLGHLWILSWGLGLILSHGVFFWNLFQFIRVLLVMVRGQNDGVFFNVQNNGVVITRELIEVFNGIF